MGAEALSTEGRKDDRGEEDNLLLRCKAVLLGLGIVGPSTMLSMLEKGKRDRQLRKEGVRTISYNTTGQSPLKLCLLQPLTTGLLLPPYTWVCCNSFLLVQ